MLTAETTNLFFCQTTHLYVIKQYTNKRNLKKKMQAQQRQNLSHCSITLQIYCNGAILYHL